MPFPFLEATKKEMKKEEENIAEKKRSIAWLRDWAKREDRAAEIDISWGSAWRIAVAIGVVLAIISGVGGCIAAMIV